MYKINLFVTLFVCVSYVSGKVNSTEDGTSSRMAWMKSLLDHHDWINVLNGSHNVSEKCESDLRQYLTALNDGLLWASKIYDASGQYSPNMLFGNEFWLGSINACRDLQHKEYYAQTPPFPCTFYVAKINLTVDGDHIPQTRPMLVGQCVPASCDKDDLKSVLDAAETAIVERAVANGFIASFTTLYVRPVPGTYDVLKDFKFHILTTVILTVSVWMLVASAYEGYLERKYRNKEPKDLEVANNNHKPTANNNNTPQASAKNVDNDIKEKDIRRDVCGVWSEILLSFSILSNGRAILSTHKPSDGALTCLHGMRFLSVLWVIMVHTYLTVFYIADNKTMRVVTERNFLYQSVGNASYCVDTFFFISGLLVTVLFLRTEESKANRKKIAKCRENNKETNKNQNSYTNSALSVSVVSQESFYEDLLDKPEVRVYSKREVFGMTKSFLVLLSYRVVRLTPAYAFVIGLNELALRYTYDHTVFEPAIFDHINCNHYWWRNLLYINNLFPQKDMCMVWSWYMANDTQFYAVGIILLLISIKHTRFAMVSLILVLVSSWATTIYVSVWHQYKARIQEPFEMFDPLYDKPWSRIGPYLVGMIVGWYLHKTKCQIKMPYWLVAVGWPASLIIIASLIFGMVDGYFEVWPTAFYVSVGHTGWGVALAWISIACCCGYGGLIKSGLSYRGLLPLSRLTYCAYLVHPTIMMYTSFLLDGPLHLENSMVLVIYSGYAVMAFLASFAISLAFEAPAVRLLKIITGGSKSEK
ncbi:O-acyltransferase like protein-like [Danaus plexippus]|uniref:O-acyltransferase like protein-like n=1 Tax=Danaus plexippus TaxID=13037 RepID=UPI002AB215B2|nr:O-acyltransferase like protein-like [Danaus plexippus]XP_061382915.1 O-acyltransferase like protein-like [Danaus plexippus]